MHRLPVILLLFYTVLSQAVIVPPHIYIQPRMLRDNSIYFIPGKTVELSCKASRSPQPLYTWYRDGLEFNPSDHDARVTQLPGNGTLRFKPTEHKDAGVYQCVAENGYGVSMSKKVNLKKAYLNEFVPRPPQSEYVYSGHPLRLPCVAPESDPQVKPYRTLLWQIAPKSKWVGKYKNVRQDKRITMDLDGGLHFKYVQKSDEQDGLAYVCVARLNQDQDNPVRGPEITLHVVEAAESKQPPQERWTSPADQLIVKGTGIVYLKCIYGGNPIPNVTWSRTGASFPRGIFITRSGHELQLFDVEPSASGQYACEVSSDEFSFRVRKNFTVRVEAAPEWYTEPKAVNKSIGDSATFICKAEGVPEPTYSWFINGVALNDTRDPRIYESSRVHHPNPNNLTISNLTLADNMVIQCNATNKHGYIWSDVVLSMSECWCEEEVDPEKCVCDGSSSVTYSFVAITSLALVAAQVTRM